MTRRTGGQLLVDALAHQGVRTIFGIPGVQLDNAADALYQAADRISFFCARNEQATTYMADGYARSTGTPGVAMVVPGPGVLNALAGLATAYSANSRVLLLAGQIDSRLIGKGYGALHEIPDQAGILSRLTKWTGTARRADDIPALVTRAFTELRGGRPRPVALELPPDVLAASTGAGTGEYAEPSPVPPSDADVERAARLLLAAERPLIYVGGGVLAAGASAALTELAEVLEAPVLVSENARGAIDARHRLAFDGLALRAFRTDADLMLGVGTRFMTTFGRQIDVGRAALVLLNADPADLGEPRAAELAIHADAGLGLRALAAAVGSPHRGSREDEFEQVRKWLEDCLADITPQRGYLAAIRSVLPDDGVFVSEFTQVGYAASVCFPVYHPRGYIGPGYQGTLGYGFATALGAKAADPSRAVISVTGDGGFSWTMQELSTLRRYGLGMVTVVFNDGYFGNVRRIQKNRYGGRYFASDLTNPDYRQLAGAFGIGFACARDPDSLAGVLRDAVAVADFTALDVVMLRRKKLRIEMENFRRELLGQEGKQIGRFDSRFCADHQYVIGTGAFDPATDDAATAGVNSAHLSGFHQHLAADLGYRSQLHYRPLNNVTIAAAWDWRHKAPGIDAPLQVPNVALDLSAAMRRNPALRVYIMGGVYDLATPFAGAEFDISHLYLSERLRRNVQFSWYESGHMAFVDEKVIPVMASDLARFYASAPEQAG